MRTGEPEDADWVSAMRQVARSQRAELDIAPPDWPVYGLADEPEPGWLAGLNQQDGAVLGVEIAYGIPSEDGWLGVSTQPRVGAMFESLDWVLASMFAADGRDYPVPGALPPTTGDGLPEAPRAEPAGISVDGMPVPAIVQRVEGYLAARVVWDDVVITVVGRGISTLPGLARVTDLAPYQQRRGERLATILARHRARAAQSALTGPDDTAPLWAHRDLVAMTIASREDHVARIALNRPCGPLDPDWGRRWDAAVRRQQQLRNQDPPSARGAVTAMVHQVGALQEDAAWWRDDRLRRRAIDEIIWVTATGEENVSSASAQRGWSVDRLVFLDAFQEWADRHAKS